MSYNALRKGRCSLIGAIYHVTTVTQGRRHVFTDLPSARRVVAELKDCQQANLAQTLCYVLMPDHLHWLLVLQAEDLSAVVRHVKGRTSRALGGAVWQPGFHDHALRREEDIQSLARYVVANRLRAGLVSHIGDYPHWYAVWLEDSLAG